MNLYKWQDPILYICVHVKLSYYIPLITGSILILTAIVNIVGFQIFSEKAFSVYIAEFTHADTSPDPEKLQAFLKLGSLDSKTREEYLSTIAELSNLSNALANISKNPELYMESQKNPSGSGTDGQILLPFVTPATPWVIPSFNIREFGRDTAEGRFVTNTFKGVIILNFCWVFLILVLYFAWIRSIFHPIRIVTENIKNIIDRKKYATIRYPGKNEFSPLISTINNLQKTLSIQEKIRSDFLSDLSHEIRTPITAVQCYLEAIEDGMMKLDEDSLPMLQAELTRLTDITGKIMDYEHLTNDLFDDVQVSNFSLVAITRQIITSYMPQIEKTGQEIHIQIGRDDMINMDQHMYIQILHNIFSNFIKYAGTQSHMTISLRKTRKEYIITFVDDGVGIPEKEIEYVKEKFYRVDKARTGERHGSMGIGLSICDRIARLHHGSLTIEKNQPHGLKTIVKIGR